MRSPHPHPPSHPHPPLTLLLPTRPPPSKLFVTLLITLVLILTLFSTSPLIHALSNNNDESSTTIESSSSASSISPSSSSLPASDIDAALSSFVPMPHPHFVLSHIDGAASQQQHSPSSSSSSSTATPPPGSTILVLGSDGLIGRATVTALRQRGYQLAEVKNRRHIDLRLPNALDVFNNANITFCIFLACEVGGSKYMHDTVTPAQYDIVSNNILMYSTVFTWLKEHSIPFVFSSTSLVLEPDSYGSMKRLGEAWIKSFPPSPAKGKIARLYNIYGPERISQRSHVIADWTANCVRMGEMKGGTNGWEKRIFVHTRDTANALVAIMEHYDEADFISDIATPDWVSLREVARHITSYYEVRNLPNPCKIIFNDDRIAAPRALLEPRRDQILWKQWWQPEVTLESGVHEMLDYYTAFYANDTTTIPIAAVETNTNTLSSIVTQVNSTPNAARDSSSLPTVSSTDSTSSSTSLSAVLTNDSLRPSPHLPPPTVAGGGRAAARDEL